ncbi:MAG TPA: hypothetical protein VFB07_02010 [Vicinamibacterales bacterium]|nr:hypothetical protein [Vicinamibacterales bacterium]
MEEGTALIVTVLLLTLVGALAAALALTTASEAILAGDFGRAQEARYAAEAALERATSDLSALADWNAALGGLALSPFADGPPNGVRTLDGGVVVDVAAAANAANCGKTTTCSAADLTANATGQRPWGADNPVWRPFAYGPLAAMVPGGVVHSAFYVIVFVGDDPAEIDGNPLVDANGAVALRAEAFGPRGAHKAIVAVVERANRPPWVRIRTEQLSGVM